jgi:hypothetical protein
MRRPGQRRPSGISQGAANTRLLSFPAPTKGWWSAQGLATAQPGTAPVLENWFPTQTGVEMRSGCLLSATIGTDEVETLMAYIGTSRKLFAADTAGIYNITSVADPDVAPAADVTGQTSGDYGWENFSTAGGYYMYAVNGANKPRLYDGTTWTAVDALSTPAITGVTTTTLSHVWSYRSRLFFIGSGMNAWALPVDSIGGAATQIALGGVFQKGGSLLLGATWSQDSGDGLDDKCVFITTEGEFAVYEGSDPSDPSDWNLVGRYDIAPPLGKMAVMRAGGDLLVATERGLIPISAAVNKDAAALDLAAISAPIAPDWTREASQRRSMPWQIAKWPLKSKAIISNPVTSDDATTPPQCFVVNLETGAWCKYTGWNTRSLVLHNDFVYFGTNTGQIMQAEVTGADDGELIYHSCVYSFDHLGRPGFNKNVIEMRGIFTTYNSFTPQLSVSIDYQLSLPAPPSAATDLSASSEWDAGLWDVALWDAGAQSYTAQTYWVGVALSGIAHAPQLQVTSGADVSSQTQLVMLDLKVGDGDDTGS